ncbi:MAG: zinc ribbon domain-containing protein [Wujia sp.]
MIAIKCPNCGSEKVQSLTEEKYVCLACDNVFLVHNASKEFRQTDEHISNVHADISSQLADIQNSVQRQNTNQGMDVDYVFQQAMNLLNTDNNAAEDIFIDIAEEHPWCYKGWYGLCLCITEKECISDFGANVELLYKRYQKMILCADLPADKKEFMLQQIKSSFEKFYQSACDDISNNTVLNDEASLENILDFINDADKWSDIFSDIILKRDNLLKQLKSATQNIIQASKSQYNNKMDSLNMQLREAQQNVDNKKYSFEQQRMSIQQQISSADNTIAHNQKKSQLTCVIIGIAAAILLLLLLFKAFVPWVIDTKYLYQEASAESNFIDRIWQYIVYTVWGLIKIALSLGILGVLSFITYKIIDSLQYKNAYQNDAIRTNNQEQTDAFNQELTKSLDYENRKLVPINQQIIECKKALQTIASKENMLSSITIDNVHDLANILDYYYYDDELADDEEDLIEEYEDKELDDPFLTNFFSDKSNQQTFSNAYGRFMKRIQSANSVLIRNTDSSAVDMQSNTESNTYTSPENEQLQYYCPVCGATTTPGTVFCTACGARLNE